MITKTMQTMKLGDFGFTYQNPQATVPLVITVQTVANTPNEVAMENARQNSLLPLAWVNEMPEKFGVALVCGAGPSLRDNWMEIEAAQRAGATIFACNSAAKFLGDKGINIAYQVLLDSNKRCIEDLYQNVGTHLVASVVDPSVLEKCTNPILWHPAMDGIDDQIPAGRTGFVCIGGGYTVSMSALCIAYTIGFRKIVVYGLDSSFKDGARYAQEQPNNPDELLVTIEEGGKTYETTWGLKQQVLVFDALAKQLSDKGVKLEVKGSGLLPERFNRKYQDYVIKDGRLVGDFETMYQRFPDPWNQLSATWETDKWLTLNLLEQLKVERVMEIGCGLGKFTNALHYRHTKALGMDVSETAIKKASETFHGPEFVCADILDFDVYRRFKPQAIVMSQVTWYVLEQLDAFLQFLRDEMPGVYLVHLLATYPPGVQKYGAEYFTDLDGIKERFGLNYICWGELKDAAQDTTRTYFLAKV